MSESALAAAVELTADPAPESLVEELTALAWFFWLRFIGETAFTAVQDLYLAIFYFAHLELLPGGDAPRELGMELEKAREENIEAIAAIHANRIFDEYLETRDRDVLASAIEALRIAVSVSKESEANERYKLLLSSALTSQFESKGEKGDIDEAVEIIRDAVSAASRSVDALGLLAPTLQARYERYGELSDLEQSIAATREAIAAAGPGHPLQGAFQSSLCNGLCLRYSHSGSAEDLEAAITAGRKAVASSSPEDRERAPRLSNLSNALYQRFELAGLADDVNEAVALDREVVDSLPPGHPDLPKYRTNLGLSLRSMFVCSGDPKHLDDALVETSEAIAGTAEGDPLLAGRLSNLGMILQSRFEQAHRATDLDLAIAACRGAVAATVPSDPHRAIRFTNLGNALFLQFEQTRSLFGLDEAIKYAGLSIAACPPDDPNLGTHLSNLGIKWLIRFRQTHEIDDLETALSRCREAVARTPAGNPSRAGSICNLGATYLERFEEVGDPADLDAAISSCREATEVVPPSHPERSKFLSSLAICFGVRHRQSGDPTHLDEAIDGHGRAVAASPIAHSARSRRLLALAIALDTRFKERGDPVDLDTAIAAWMAAANEPSGVPDARIKAARAWGHAAMSAGRVEVAADGLERAIELLPLLAWHGLPQTAREEHLTLNRDLASDAAACAIAAGRNEAAVQLLEAGRAMLWTQRLDLRGELSALSEQAPDLAEELEELRQSLNLAMPEDSIEIDKLGEDYRSMHTNLSAWRMRIARRFDELVGRVRELDGFSGFLARPQLSDLLACAAVGPIAIVNISRYGCHAMLLTAAGVDVLELSNVATEESYAKGNAMLDLMRRAREPAAEDSEVEVEQQVLFEILEWLWETVTGPVLDALGFVSGPSGDTAPPRIWWCPTGPLANLPLHAAGVGLRHPGAERRQSALDRVVSSYTPTVAALARARSAPQATESSLLAIGMPTSPGNDDLPGVSAELDAIDARWPISTRLQTPTREQLELGIDPDSSSQPTVERVKEQLARHPCVHIACHASQHSGRPAASALWLADGPLAITSLLESRDSNPRELAVLSACDTAASSIAMPDEAINLAVSMHHLGYRNVIAALWSVYDSLAVDLANLLYEGLASKGTVEAAYAVHRAVTIVREHFPGDPLAWAPYIHIGP